MHTGELYLGMYLDLAGLAGRADEYGSGAPLHGAGIGIDGGIADDFALALYGEADVFLGETAHMTLVVGDLADDDDEVGAVGNELMTHLVGTQAQLGAAARWHLLFRAYHLAVDEALCHHLHTLPRLLCIAMVAGFEEVPRIFEDDKPPVNGQRPAVLAVVHGEAHAVAVAENGDILLGELRHLMGKSHDGLSYL